MPPIVELCTFRDYDLWNKPDRTGHNKVGYITLDRKIVYRVRNHYVTRDMHSVFRKARGRKPVIFTLEVREGFDKIINSFFTENVLHPLLVEQGLQALAAGKVEHFENPIRLPRLIPITAEEHDQRWEKMLSVIEAGDLLFTFDEDSRVSKLIATFDYGPWSHVGAYTGRHTIFEAVTSGVTERDINVYSSPHYRIGVYRLNGMTPQGAERAMEWSAKQIGRKYGWRMARRIAWRRLTHFQKIPEFLLTPNDVAVRFNGRLVHLV